MSQGQASSSSPVRKLPAAGVIRTAPEQRTEGTRNRSGARALIFRACGMNLAIDVSYVKTVFQAEAPQKFPFIPDYIDFFTNFRGTPTAVFKSTLVMGLDDPEASSDDNDQAPVVLLLEHAGLAFGLRVDHLVSVAFYSGANAILPSAKDNIRGIRGILEYGARDDTAAFLDGQVLASTVRSLISGKPGISLPGSPLV